MSHLTYEQRYTIEVLLKSRVSKPEISKVIGVNKSIVYREVHRNMDLRNKEYKASLAQKKYQKRQKDKPKHVRFTEQVEIKVRSYLEQDYSPEQISGVFKRDGYEGVSHERIYQFIWNDKKNNGELHKHLRNKGRRYRKRGANKDSRGIIKNRVGIDKRPEEAEHRTVFGHLEVDTIIGEKHKGAIVTLNDRASGMLWMRKVVSRDAQHVSSAIMKMLDEIRPFIKSITADNGKEFAMHQIISDHYCDFFFADPYSPWQRGSNENLNGLVRQYIPKSSDILNLTNQMIMSVQDKINSRPRKRYEFQNPIFVMEKLLFNDKVAFIA
ncbi:MAG: IS30 family transposase [Crocinitomicaceae bacterium]|nr:IS30 family transposase [Crocinitomicaceae bacterium]